jgi:hypothetical protein
MKIDTNLTSMHDIGTLFRIRETRPGQANWVDPDTTRTCGGCQHHDGKACSLYAARMRKRGPSVPAHARACRDFAGRGES